MSLRFDFDFFSVVDNVCTTTLTSSRTELPPGFG